MGRNWVREKSSPNNRIYFGARHNEENHQVCLITVKEEK